LTTAKFAMLPVPKFDVNGPADVDAHFAALKEVPLHAKN
jgi:hypothetical protein